MKFSNWSLIVEWHAFIRNLLLEKEATKETIDLTYLIEWNSTSIFTIYAAFPVQRDIPQFSR